MGGKEGTPQGEPPREVIARIEKDIDRGKINPKKLLLDADYLLQNAPKDERALVRPFLQEAARRTPPGTMERTLIGKLDELDQKKIPDKRETIRRYVQLGQDLNIQETEAGQQFIDALTEKYQLNRYIWHAKEGDLPVKVIGSLGEGPDGRQYLAIEGSLVGVPKDQLTEAEYVDEEGQNQPKGGHRIWRRFIPFAKGKQAETHEIDPKTEGTTDDVIPEGVNPNEVKKAKEKIASYVKEVRHKGPNPKKEKEVMSEVARRLGVKGELFITDGAIIRDNPDLYTNFVSFNYLLGRDHQQKSENNHRLLADLLEAHHSPSMINALANFQKNPQASIERNIYPITFALGESENLFNEGDWALYETGVIYTVADTDFSNRVADLGEILIQGGLTTKDLQEKLEEISQLSNKRAEALVNLMIKTNEFMHGLAQEAGIIIKPGQKGHSPATLEKIKGVRVPLTSTTSAPHSTETPRATTAGEPLSDPRDILTSWALEDPSELLAPWVAEQKAKETQGSAGRREKTTSDALKDPTPEEMHQSIDAAREELRKKGLL